MKTLNQFVRGSVIASVLTIAAYGDGFTATGGAFDGRWNHTATRLPDGRVLVVAGRDPDLGQLSVADLYNPVTGTWTYAGSLDDPREFHTATLLPNVGITSIDFSCAALRLVDTMSGPLRSIRWVVRKW